MFHAEKQHLTEEQHPTWLSTARTPISNPLPRRESLQWWIPKRNQAERPFIRWPWLRPDLSFETCRLLHRRSLSVSSRTARGRPTAFPNWYWMHRRVCRRRKRTWKQRKPIGGHRFWQRADDRGADCKAKEKDRDLECNWMRIGEVKLLFYQRHTRCKHGGRKRILRADISNFMMRPDFRFRNRPT